MRCWDIFLVYSRWLCLWHFMLYFCFIQQCSVFLIQMQNSSEESGQHSENSVHHVKEDSEYVRLVISDEPRAAEADILQSQQDTRSKSFFRWIKALALFILILAVILIFIKWGVPFLFEKVTSYAYVLLFLLLLLHLFSLKKKKLPVILDVIINRNSLFVDYFLYLLDVDCMRF